MSHPIKLLHLWLEEEQQAGAPNPQQAVLCTADKKANPHGRVVAIREITEQSLLFFTQKPTKKVMELSENPFACIVFWFELFQREVILKGPIEALSLKENQHYWQMYSPFAQIRFHSYAPTSGQPIASKTLLEEKRRKLEQQYNKTPIPMSPFYCGFKLLFNHVLFYSYRTDELSDVFAYQKHHDTWQKIRISP
ncbi:pyridoxine/pyridoxamine 5'-phosphate oxidase [Legionella gresilensis]|uniref:pyridoxine/pyridoxamine 5'-phosphate oxidase n=1 Tax=Legionella gresilensis TaxID=91823 RepID=UPI0013EF9F81|nr:pyridoxamine 5'-phosphate oxidase family protein [Legionella gresilensis]